GAASTPRTFGYDAFSRMTVATNGANSVVYTYDAVGRKVKRLKRDATIYPDSTYYVYDGLDPVCMVEFNPAHTECTTVTWLTRGLGVAPGIGNIVAQQRYTINFNGTASQPVMHYYHPNHRGDTAYLTDASGVKVASYIYDAFGRMLTDSPATLTDYRFSGKEWDPDAQLYYFGFRWYDPDTGTWTTKDPLKFRGGDINIYRFASNDPLNHHDSYGLWTTANMTDGSQFNNDPMLSNTFAEIRQAERDTWNQGLDNYAEGLNTLVEAVDGVSLAIKAGIKWLIGLLKIDPCS
ncbi:MAG: RHS repeat-associated core domain-containing protein, partial [bacterium]|nr:RHS repeat-associated core domain-containing protein [bacterium]